VIRDVSIAVDLENSYLLIRTDKEAGDGGWVAVTFYDDDDNYAGAFRISFEPDPGGQILYALGDCMEYFHYFQTSVPSERQKTWVLEKRGKTFRVYCNGKKVIDVTATTELCDHPECIDTWAIYYGRTVHSIKFKSELDSASNSYFMGKAFSIHISFFSF
jgi:hypothetical protein